MTELTFEEPPPPARAPRGFDEVAAQLKERKGEWAIVAVFDKRTNAGSLVRRITHGMSKCWREAGDFEATARTIARGEHRVYARYMGDERRGDE